MPFYRSGLSALILFMLCGCLFVSSCISKSNKPALLLKRYIQTADSLATAGKSAAASKALMRQRMQFKNGNPELSAYYIYIGEHYAPNIIIKSRYADSALAVFSNKDNIKNYPDEYFKTLLTKGDACIALKQYQNALEYYDKAQKLLVTHCDDGDIANKIAAIYYNQQNYRMAARYWVKNLDRLLSCPKIGSALKDFYLEQGTLDNIGVSYQKAGVYDSAAYYYYKDLAFINRTDSLNKLEKISIIPARVVLYDNLGGLYLDQNKLDSAEKYLSECLALPVKDADGMRISPFIKRAQLYLKTGRNNLARTDFETSRQLLNLYGKDNPTPDVEWNRLYAQYLYAQHQSDQAYVYQAKYIHIKDSVNNANAQIQRLDVDREFDAIHRDNLLADLEHKEKLDKIYIAAITIAVILLLAISMFINKVLLESRKNHRNTRLHNEQLQQTLDELERANTNIKRIMRIMAHDLRNPLSGMIGLANAIIDDEISEENKQMLRLLESTGMHSLEMINELLKTGLADEKEPLVKQTLDIKELLRDSVELLQYKATEKQQHILFDGGSLPIITAVNHEKIWRVFNNLIVNAIKFSYSGGTIKVGVNKNAGRVLISIADNGIGIPDKNKDSIFEMFTTAKREGTNGEQPFGLGLSISKRIIESHGGKLWFESNLGVGAVFYIELPLQQ